MTSSSPPSRLSRSRVLAAGLTLAALGVAGAALASWRADARLRDELVASVRGLGVEDAAVEREVRWAADGDRARIVAGRALVVAGLGEGGAPPPDPKLAVNRFERAASLGGEVLARRPTSREAATLAGAARYLAWSTARDPRLVTEHARWEEPLRLARRLGPGDREAARFLAMAYLELWSSLAESKRTEARDVVAVAFGDIDTFYRLIDTWIAVAGTGAKGLAPVPPLPAAWSHLAERLAATGRAEDYCRVRERLFAALDGELEERLADARRRLAGGEPADARARFLAAIAELPPDSRFADRVAAALRETPAGPPEPPRFGGLRSWLRSELDLAALGRPRLEARGIETLTRAAGLVLPGPEAPDSVLALAAESAIGSADLVAAERFERMAAALTSGVWARYWLAKARLLADRADGDGLRRALAALAVSGPGRFEIELAEIRRIAAGAQRNGAELAAAQGDLDRFAAGRWGLEAWQLADRGAHLVFRLGGPARGVRLELRPDAVRGAAVVSLDGREVACRAVGAPTTLRVTTVLEPGLHRIEVSAPRGLEVFPVEMVVE